MDMQTRTTDANGFIGLPESFANTTVIIEQVSDSEIRIRKAEPVLEDEVVFQEEIPTVLSNRDRDLFLELIENPPPPNEALKRAMREHAERYG